MDKEVKILMILKDITQTQLAKNIGVSVQMINYVVNGKKKTRWIREAIAEELKVPVEKLWKEE